MGDTWSDVLTVDDLSYDGFKETNVWTNGLGMLTDGQYGLDNFKMDLGARKGKLLAEYFYTAKHVYYLWVF